MIAGLVISANISLLLVFAEGLLSFFSPCVVPLIPIYMSYLAGNAKRTSEDGTITYVRKKVLFHTLFFVLGISTAFFILGLSLMSLRVFFMDNQLLFTRIGGILIIALGLIQIGIFDFRFLQKECRFHINMKDRQINPFIAFLMGFTFSFAWTPCNGPALAAILVMATRSNTVFTGNLLILLYTGGFVIPFLLLGFFTAELLNFLKKHQNILRYTVKAGGILLIIIGFMTFTGWMNGISSYLNPYTPRIEEGDEDNSDTATDTENSSATVSDAESNSNTKSDTENNSNTASDTEDSSGNEKEDADEDDGPKYPAIDFTLTDQYGKEHTLSDYKGKVVFLNFWATWCGPCQREMPDIEEIYQEYGQNSEDIIILGVANPKSEEYPRNIDISKDEIIAFLEDKEFTFPTLFDETGEIFYKYAVRAYPTTYFIDMDGNIYGYAPGMMTKDIMINNINATLEATK